MGGKVNAANQIAAGNRHRAFHLRPTLGDYGGQVSFDEAMKFGYHHCSQRQVPACPVGAMGRRWMAVPKLWR